MFHGTDPAGFEKETEKPDLKVFVHTGLSGVHVFGHMTIAYQGITYSYGNYDTANEKTLSIHWSGDFVFV